MEPDVALARWDEKGRLTVWSPCQNAHLAKKAMAQRIFDIGEGIHPLGHHDRWRGLRGQDELLRGAGLRDAGQGDGQTRKGGGNPGGGFFNGWNSRTEQRQTIKMGVKKDGTMTALSQKILSDAGAYFSHSGTISAVNMQSTLGSLRSPASTARRRWSTPTTPHPAA